jgi:hypothetical protein
MERFLSNKSSGPVGKVCGNSTLPTIRLWDEMTYLLFSKSGGHQRNVAWLLPVGCVCVCVCVCVLCGVFVYHSPVTSHMLGGQ